MYSTMLVMQRQAELGPNACCGRWAVKAMPSVVAKHKTSLSLSLSFFPPTTSLMSMVNPS